jgi:hypothetical protein
MQSIPNRLSFLRRTPLLALTACIFAFPSFAASHRPASDPLVAGFRAPPQIARPRVWWHWMNGNVTKDGIRKDLEWMKSIGIGGVDAIDASIDTPQVVKRRLVYMTPEWKDAFRYAVRLTDRFGMEMAINSSPGWSETGGPWVTPDAAMKKLVWSRVEVEGGKPFRGVLRQPPDNIGPFQNAPFSGDIKPTPKAAALRFYRDSIVVAYRLPAELPTISRVTSNSGLVDAAKLQDGDLTNDVTLSPGADGTDASVTYEFANPATIQGLSLAVSTPKGFGYMPVVEASDDGKAWRHVADMPLQAQLQRMVMIHQTVSFPPAKGRFFRVVFRTAEPLPTSLRPRAPAPGLIEGAKSERPARTYKVSELVFQAGATVNEFERKAQFAAPPRDFYTLASAPDFAAGTAIDPSQTVVLTDRMMSDGTLDWLPPPGRWVILRLGYSLTGSENHPATAEATGLEVDKLNAAHVRDYMSHYLDLYEDVTGPKLFGVRGLQALVVDSAEIGMQNWTEDVLSEFRRLRGYDPAPWLPVLTGAAVKSPADSDRFLWDFRRTLEDLYARNHFGTIGDIARERHLINYGESIEDHRPTFGDDMEMRQYTTIPMGAMWTYGEKYPSAFTYEADLLGAASVAHVYGQNLVAAESLTSALQPWSNAPSDLKSFIDLEFARSVNRVVIHTSVHQPVDRPPGLSLFGYGQFFNRLETWAPEAGPWISYIARSSWLLQQGRFSADIAYFYGEEAPITSLWGNKRVDDVPPGYAFDFVDRDSLINQLSVDRGELVTKSGMRYRVLYLGGSSRYMTLPTLTRIAELVKQGAIVVGKRPLSSPSLADDNTRFQSLADALFAEDNEHVYGKGRVFSSGSLSSAFTTLALAQDFDASQPDVLWLHRKLKDAELYFVSNRSDQAVSFDATFRVAGKTPELFDAVTGAIAPAAYRSTGERTQVSLSLPVHGSSFVVFRKPAKKSSLELRAPTESIVQSVKGPWTIVFQPRRGAPANVTQTNLVSWSESAEPGVKYFSGEGTYLTTFTTPGKRRGARYVLDLGSVREIAEVTLNDRRVGTVWTTPFSLDVTKALRPGRNVLKVKVVNLWVNRLIGDAQPDAKKKYTFTTIPTYRPDAPLRESGLLGPVTIRRVD